MRPFLGTDKSAPFHRILRRENKTVTQNARAGVLPAWRRSSRLHQAARARPFTIARQIFSGLSGISRWRTPKGASASITAFTMAGVEAIVPASPTPFTPSGFTGVRVSVEAVSNQEK